MERPPLVTLLTDFGSRDAYVGIMKGVILGMAPTATFVDLCHEIPPQNVAHGAFMLWSAIEHFPPGTIHVAVVDPGVGGARRAIVVEAGRQCFVAPDNGLLWETLGRFPEARAYHLDDPSWFLPEVSATFHGRDVFAAVAGHLASGKLPKQMGSLIPDPVSLDLFDATMDEDGIQGRILLADHFGNLVTNISFAMLRWLSPERVAVKAGALSLHGLKQTFSDVEHGEAVAYINSYGLLEIAVRNDSAEETLGLALDSPISLTLAVS